MTILRRLLARTRAQLGKDELERRMDDEMRFHLEMQTRENLEAGMPAEEARRAAVLSFGGVEQVKETCRDQRRLGLLEDLLQDLRYGARMLRRSPGFAATAVLTLALGIGACTAIFSVVNSVLLRPLPFPEPDRVVVFNETLLGRSQDFRVSSGTFHDWQKQAQSFESIAAITGGGHTMSGVAEPVRLTGLRISINTLSTLGLKPLLGRDFLPEEVPAVRDFENFAILGYGLWQRLFGGRSDVVGQIVQLSGRPVTIVGVLPRDTGLGDGEIFTPLAFSEFDRRYYDTHWLQVFGRLRAGVTIAQAQSEMSAIAKRSEQAHPASRGWGVRLVPMTETVLGEVRPVLFSLLGAVAFLLLIACANVANLLLARAMARSKEMAMRAALGAGRARIIRQVLAESVLLAVLSGALGLLVARGGLAALLALAPETLPRAQYIVLDGRALGLTLALAILTGLAFGMVPAFQAARAQLHVTLKRASHGSRQGGHRQRLRNAVVVGEVAIALVLLAGAGLLMRSFSRLVEVDPGFNPREALAASVFLQISLRSPDAKARSVAFANAAVDRMAALPGVRAASVVTRLPFEGGQTMPFTIPGRSPPAGAERPVSTHFNVGPDYFRAMGIPVLRGRAFEARDVAGAPMVAIVNESIAKKFFPGDDPLGKRVSIGGPPCEIVGIAGDVRADRLDGEASFQTYQPFAQAAPVRGMAFVVRTAGSPASHVGAVRAVLSRLDPSLPTQRVRPLSTLVADSIARQRFAMTLFAVFSGVALLLAAVGIYGVMAYSVSQRTGEIGIRMALGAHTGNVLRLVFAQGGRLIALGVLVGVIGALLLTRFLEKMLFNLSTSDPATFVAIVVLMVAVASVACLLPARRASKVSPMTALRAE
jgi:putative ABC transport system permease protein